MAKFDEIYKWLLCHINEANALATVSSALFAFFALIVAIVSIVYTHRSLSVQRRHNVLSVRPLPFLNLNKINGLRITLENHGFGPFQIISADLQGGVDGKWNLADYIPNNPPQGVAVLFTTGLTDRTIAVDGKIDLIDISAEDFSQNALSYINQCYMNLKDITISIEFTDIYRNKFDNYQKSLLWLSRN